MIYRTILDKTEGDTSSEGTTLTYTYQVIADKLDTAGKILSTIYSSSDSVAVPDRLPRRGELIEGSYIVESVNLSWAEDRNFRDFGDTKGKKVWTYEVTASVSNDVSDINTASDSATDISLSPVYYDEFTEYCYDYDSFERDIRLVNAVGDSIGRNVKKWNLLLSFSYTTNRFDADWVNYYLNTLNLNDIRVAGIDLPSRTAKITELVPTVQNGTSSDGSSVKRYQVKVGIEIESGKFVGGDRLIGNGFNAYFSGVKRKIQRWMASTVYVDGRTLVVTPDSAGIANVKKYFEALNKNNKENGLSVLYEPEFVTDSSGRWHNYLGYFGGAIGASEGQWEDIQEPVVLNADGTVCTKSVISLDDPDLNIIEAFDCAAEDWKALGFPRRGFLS